MNHLENFATHGHMHILAMTKDIHTGGREEKGAEKSARQRAECLSSLTRRIRPRTSARTVRDRMPQRFA
eukprot:2992673-Pyramimonas_sp.AAC.1